MGGRTARRTTSNPYPPPSAVDNNDISVLEVKMVVDDGKRGQVCGIDGIPTKAGGLPYNTFTLLYDSTVWPTITYGSAITGYCSYLCINALHYNAMCFFLGVGRYTPNIAFRVKWDGYSQISDSGNPFLNIWLECPICLIVE